MENKPKMAIKQDTLVMAAVIIVAIIMLKPAAIDTTNNGVPTTNGGIDLCKLVESEMSFTGQRMFLASTALTAEWARVIKSNGDGTIKDKGQISMNSGTTDTVPKAAYKIYLGENSSTYYTQPKSYTAPCSDATDDIGGVLGYIDTTPTLTAFDEYGRPSTAQALVAGDVKDVSVRVKVSADQCYGNPNAPSKNALCVKYITNNSGYDSIKASTPSQDTPYTISANNATTKYAIDCYELDLLKDTEYQDITLTLDVKDSFVYTSEHTNITVMVDDIAFDLDADTLDEIWGFEDEDNNELGDTGLGNSVIITTTG